MLREYARRPRRNGETLKADVYLLGGVSEDAAGVAAARFSHEAGWQHEEVPAGKMLLAPDNPFVELTADDLADPANTLIREAFRQQKTSELD